jgi:hypothetical protein
VNLAPAIRRASQQARNAMYALDAQAVADLLTIYQDAAAEVRGRLNAVADAGGTVPPHQLQTLLGQIETVIDGLGLQRDQLLGTAIEQAAALGVRPFTAPGVLAVGGTQAVLDSAAASRINERAVSFVREFVQADGLALSDRVWRLDRGAKETLTRAIGMAVVQGQSAATAAQQLLMRGEPLPADVAARLQRAKVPALVKTTDLLTNASTGAFANAQRVMRTEINRAHGEAFMAAGEGTPGFTGWRYLLSPRHPAPDVCNLLSAQNLYGLGRGVYPSRQATPWPAHPNTLSFVELVFVDEVTAEDRAGKQTSLQALQQLSPEVRAGALGQGKAAYFDKGLLTTGMIRAPLRAVEQRLGRQGKIN